MDYIIISGIIIQIILVTLLLLRQPVTSKAGIAIPHDTKNKTMILDSCALIDGRVVDIIRIGFLPHTIIIPSFIIKELQLLADGKDAHKRERARFGLQIVQELQQLKNSTVIINTTNPIDAEVDDKLVSLAGQLQANLFTTDYNLNQVASIKGITVLNVNELAHAIRPVVLPGEQVTVSVVQSGTNKDQGVGYLDDGTMIVIDGASRDIGKRLQVKITKSHQSVAGKMLFAQKIASTQKDKKKPHRTNSLPSHTEQYKRDTKK